MELATLDRALDSDDPTLPIASDSVEATVDIALLSDVSMSLIALPRLEPTEDIALDSPDATLLIAEDMLETALDIELVIPFHMSDIFEPMFDTIELIAPPIESFIVDTALDMKPDTASLTDETAPDTADFIPSTIPLIAETMYEAAEFIMPFIAFTICPIMSSTPSADDAISSRSMTWVILVSGMISSYFSYEKLDSSS
jgi:hypothetical protein